ncbi:NAD(P)H-dependent oxidoreductase [Salibacterium sp. K-3]
MERILIWFMHPDRESFNGAVLDTLQQELESFGTKTHVRHIPELDISPHLTKAEYNETLQGKYPAVIKREHAWMEWADGIVLVFPLWWGNFPAEGKGFIDRVLSYGFAYTLQGESPIPKMEGKKIGAVYTTGAPEDEFAESRKRLETLWEEQIFSFCGFESLSFLHLGNVVQTGDTGRKERLEKVKEYAEKLAVTEP